MDSLQPQPQVLYLAQLQYKVKLEVVAMVVFYFLWLDVVCNYFVALEGTPRPKHGKGFVGGNYSWTHFALEFINWLVSTPRIAPLGGTIIEVK